MPRGRPATLKFTPVLPAKAAVMNSLELSLIDGGVVTVDEACRLMRRSRSKLYELMNSGELAFVQDGDGCHRFIPRAVIAAYWSRHLKQK